MKRLPSWLERLVKRRISEKLFVLNKPLGLSTYSLVDLVKQALKPQKVGHGGTLDPLATGEVVLGLDTATTQLTYWLQQDKAYEVKVVWGIGSESFDLETPLVGFQNVRLNMEPEHILSALKVVKAKQTIYIGKYSALKSSGKPLYTTENTEKLKPNRVYNFDLIEHRIVGIEEIIRIITNVKTVLEENLRWYLKLPIKGRGVQVSLFKKLISQCNEHIKMCKRYPHLKVGFSRIYLEVGKGTYVRYIVRELGEMLGYHSLALGITRTYLIDHKKKRQRPVK